MVKMTQPKLYTRGNKLWVRFSLNGEVIKRSLNLDDNKVNRKTALNQIVPQMILKAHSGEFFKNITVPTVSQMIDISMNMNSNNRKYLTIKGYKTVFEKHIIPYFGNKKINTIKASDLTLWQNNLLDTYSSKYVANIRIIFNGIFQDALRDEIIDKNPLSIVKAPTQQSNKEIYPFDKNEIFKILDNANPKIKAFFAIGFFTGMRTGEITALKWSDIDIENKIISVKATRNKGIETTPKTKSSIRDVDILDVLLPYIKDHLQYQTNDSIYLFTNKFNKPYYSASKISFIYWEKILSKLDIPHRTLYQMRHTFASLMISSGEDILWVSNMLGHKNANITLSVYAKYIKSDKKQRGKFLLN